MPAAGLYTSTSCGRLSRREVHLTVISDSAPLLHFSMELGIHQSGGVTDSRSRLTQIPKHRQHNREILSHAALPEKASNHYRTRRAPIWFMNICTFARSSGSF